MDEPTFASKRTHSLVQGLPTLSNLQHGREASLILPRLYLSGITTALDSNALSILGITHVITVLDYEPGISEEAIKLERRLHIKVADDRKMDLLHKMDETTEFIKNALDENEDNKVLVHCFMGISRSVTIVSAYLIATLGMTGPEAIEFVRSKRPIACPNIGFRNQLEEYECRFVGGRAGGEVKKARVSEGVRAIIKRLQNRRISM